MKALCFFFILIWPWALLAQGWPELPQNPLEGQALLREKHCHQCHAILGQGGSGGPDLGRLQYNRSFFSMMARLWNHFPRMQASYRAKGVNWPRLSPREMNKLIVYLYALNYFDQESNPGRGELLFSEKACNRCHRLGGKGGRLGPALDRYQNDLTPAYLVADLWNRSPAKSRAFVKMRIQPPQLGGNDVTDLLAYIQAKGLSEPAPLRKAGLPNPKMGKVIFQKKCANCHQRGQRGMNLAFSELKGTRSSILGRLWNLPQHRPGKRAAYPKLQAEEIDPLAMYLYFLSFADQPGRAELGQRLVIEKGCVQCHRFQARPPGKLPQNPLELLSRIWNHAPRMARAMKRLNRPWPRFEPEQMRDLLAYLGEVQASR